MSLHAPLFYVIPDETVQVAKAAFPKGNRYLLLRDTFGGIVREADGGCKQGVGEMLVDHKLPASRPLLCMFRAYARVSKLLFLHGAQRHKRRFLRLADSL